MSLRFGFIGVGGIAGQHLNAARDNKYAITAVYDINPETMKTRQKEYAVAHLASSAQELADRPDVDAIVVSTPQHVHLDGIRAACNAGKPVMCEKPLARTLEDAQEAVHLVEESGIVMQVAFVRRYCPEWGMFKQLIEQDLLGSPVAWWTAGG